MKTLLLVTLLSQASSAAKHSFTLFFTASYGLPNFPEFLASGTLDGFLLGYCDTNKKSVELRQDWMKAFLELHPKELEWYASQCFVRSPSYMTGRIYSLMDVYNQSGGFHVLQRIDYCVWDDDTGEVTGSVKYGYDGEDLLELDLETLTWIALKPQAVPAKQRWDAEKDIIVGAKSYITEVFPAFLKNYIPFVKMYLRRTDFPTVSLLQKSPSSPVSCHATGFYPDRATLFWRKGEEELHEEVDLRETLPNPDGTFQMRVDLNISLVPPEDWRRYECVFQLYGVKEEIVTTLDKDKIRTNWGRNVSSKPSNTVIGVVVGLLVVLAAVIIGFLIWRRSRNKSSRETNAGYAPPSGVIPSESSQ